MSNTTQRRYYYKKVAINITTGYDKPFCTECGTILNITEVEFHHIDPKEKCGNPSDILRAHGGMAYLKEIVKCRPVCKSCHAELHK